MKKHHNEYDLLNSDQKVEIKALNINVLAEVINLTSKLDVYPLIRFFY